MDKTFSLPNLEKYLDMNEALYRQEIMELRESHDTIIGEVDDEQLDTVAEFYAPITAKIFASTESDEETEYDYGADYDETGTDSMTDEDKDDNANEEDSSRTVIPQ